MCLLDRLSLSDILRNCSFRLWSNKLRDAWWKFCVWLTDMCRPMRAWDEALVLRCAEFCILDDFGFGSLGLESLEIDRFSQRCPNIETY